MSANHTVKPFSFKVAIQSNVTIGVGYYMHIEHNRLPMIGTNVHAERKCETKNTKTQAIIIQRFIVI